MPPQPKPKRTKRGVEYDRRFVDYLASIDDASVADSTDDLPRGIIEAYEEDRMDRREWNGDAPVDE